MTDNSTPPPSDEESLTHVGWWCWRGDNHGHLATMACRSDNVPIHVPAEWADEMRAVIQRIEDGDEDEEQPAVLPAVTVPPTTHAAVLTDTDRQFLTFAHSGLRKGVAVHGRCPGGSAAPVQQPAPGPGRAADEGPRP